MTNASGRMKMSPLSLSSQLPSLKMGYVISYYHLVSRDGNIVNMVWGGMEIKLKHKNLVTQSILLLKKKKAGNILAGRFLRACVTLPTAYSRNN